MLKYLPNDINLERQEDIIIATDKQAVASTMSFGKYAQSPEWANIEPIPLDDGSGNGDGIIPLATIAYSPAYTEATSYLRAVMAANEMSERALKLTEDIIAINPAHYTVWYGIVAFAYNSFLVQATPRLPFS